jgi:hypothetical protein
MTIVTTINWLYIYNKKMINNKLHIKNFKDLNYECK